MSDYQSAHRFAWTDEAGEDSTAARFGRFWSRLAGEFLDEAARAEYNALKHGNRVRAGGFTFAMGFEEAHGVPASPEDGQVCSPDAVDGPRPRFEQCKQPRIDGVTPQRALGVSIFTNIISVILLRGTLLSIGE